MKQRLAALRADIAATTPASVLLALVTLLVTLHLLARGLEHLTEDRLSLEQRFVDGTSYVSHRVANERFDADLNLVLLGASVTRESVLPDAELERRLAAVHGGSVRVRNLGCTNQTLQESYAILASLDAPPGTVVLMQSSFRKLNKDAAWYRDELLAPRFTNVEFESVLRFHGPVQAALYHATPDLLRVRTPISHYLEVRSCALATLWDPQASAHCLRPIRVVRHFYSRETQLSPGQKRSYVAEVEATRLPEAVAHHEEGYRWLGRLRDLAAERGFRYVLLDYPVAPLARPMERRVRAMIDYESSVEPLAGTARWDLAFDPDFADRDYHDTYHLIGSGKDKLSEKLIDRMRKLL